MVIAVDGNEANVDEKVGVSVYTQELLQYFHKKSTTNLQFVVYLREQPGQQLPPPTTHFRYRVVSGSFLWSQLFLPLALYRDRHFDVFFSPAHYTPRLCPAPVVVTIHDLSYFYYADEFLKKDLYKLRHWTRSAIMKSKKIIAVSDFTKKDIYKQFTVDKQKVTTIHNGYRLSLSSDSNASSGTLPEAITHTPYILYVGTLQPRKNITTLIEAFSRVKKKNPDLKLVIAGKKGWLYESIFRKVQDLELDSDVVFTGYVDDATLARLYAEARLFVLPSLYEGFGIPILEAMHHGCAVIAANTSSLPEVGGDACLYFNPNDTIELEQCIRRLIDDTSLRDSLVKRGYDRIKLFSWDTCAQETLETIQKAL